MFRLILTTTAYVHGLLAYAPSNLLLDRIRTREGLKWGKRAMLLAIPYFAIAYWCTTIIDNGGPGWLQAIRKAGASLDARACRHGPLPR